MTELIQTPSTPAMLRGAVFRTAATVMEPNVVATRTSTVPRLARPECSTTGRLTLRTIRQELSRRATGRMDDGTRLHHLDGLDLCNDADIATSPLPDLRHPTPRATP